METSMSSVADLAGTARLSTYSPSTRTSQQSINAEVLRCRICKHQLTACDKQKTTNKYWKSCKSCRERNNQASKRRNRTLLPPANSTDTSNISKKRFDVHYAIRQVHSLFNPKVSAKPRAKKTKKTILSPHPPAQNATHLPVSNTSRTSVLSEPSAELSSQSLWHETPPLATAQEDFGTSNIATSGITHGFEDDASPDDKWNPQWDEQLDSSFLGVIEPEIAVQDEQKANEQDCSVCAESFAVQDYPGLIACEHVPDVCHECFLQWLDQQMTTTSWEQILCPSSGCNNPITHDDVKMHAPQDVFTRFDELSMRSVLSADADFLYCLSPGCASGQVHDTGVEGPIFRCAACKFRMCTAHTPVIPFHENETCAQYTERIAREQAEREAREAQEPPKRQDEEASMAKVKQDSVECPGCGANIMKTDGCDHMTCRRPGCNFEFCYRCRAPYRGAQGIYRVGNSAHAEGCTYHPSKLPNYQGGAT